MIAPLRELERSKRGLLLAAMVFAALLAPALAQAAPGDLDRSFLDHRRG
jgi:hypothetical protein